MIGMLFKILAHNNTKRSKYMINNNIKCDVRNCKHNCQGTNCELSSITVTCGCQGNCTCCGDFAER